MSETHYRTGQSWGQLLAALHNLHSLCLSFFYKAKAKKNFLGRSWWGGQRWRGIEDEYDRRLLGKWTPIFVWERVLKIVKANIVLFKVVLCIK